MDAATRFAARSPGAAVPVLAPAVLLLVSLVPAHAERLPLPPAEQEKVNDAIDRGVIFLRKTQAFDGSWMIPAGPHRVGYAALPALTLLECGETADSPQVKKAIHFVRRHSRDLDTTYELSLSILLLDRAGDPQDHVLIQTLALRLIAGQTMTGGWGYRCPTLTPRHQKDLLVLLQRMNPRPAPGLLAGGKPPPAGIPAGPGKNPGPATGPAAPAAGLPPPAGTAVSASSGPDKSPFLSGISSGSIASPGGTALTTATGSLGSGKTAGPAPSAAPLPPAGDKPKGQPDKPPPAGKEERKKNAPLIIPEALQRLPVLQDPAAHVLVDPPRRTEEKFLATTDNSNTQFAILALWVAQRYDVPMERTMNLVVRRFQTSQNANGSWSYRYNFGGGGLEKPSMDCVGLIGLAVGHGIAQPPGANGAAGGRKNVQDPRILNGFVALYPHVGHPTGRMVNISQVDLYYLWSLERVAVIYDLPRIGDKDWYRWGAEMLVANQHPFGNWDDGRYHQATPVLDTCMALLFLKRANLAKDLPEKLPIDPDELAKAVHNRVAPTGTPAKPPAPPPPVEPPAPAPTPPPPAPPPPAETVQAPAAPPPVSAPVVEDEGSNRKGWAYLFLGVFLVLALFSLLLLWRYNVQKKQGEKELSKTPDEEPEVVVKRPGKLGPKKSNPRGGTPAAGP